MRHQLECAAGVLARATALVALGLVALPGIAAAHTLSGKVDTPLPFVAYIAGAAAAVALSFLFVAISDPGPPQDPDPDSIRRVPRVVVLFFRGLGLFAWLWILAQTIIGGSSDADVASLFLWNFGWVGLAIVCALIGPVWSWIDPFSTLHDMGAWLLRRTGIKGLEPQPIPGGMGIWAAVAGFIFFVWLELVAKVASGQLLGLVLVGYTVVTLVAMVQYGADGWRRQGETFSVWFGLLGRLAPYGQAGSPMSGLVHRRPFASGLISDPWSIDRVVLVSLATGAILYDGASQTSLFFNLFGTPNNFEATLIMAGFLGILVGLVLLVGRLVGIAAIGAGLVPVALGYLVAHYFTFLVVDGQRIVIAISDPFQQGWNIFNTAFYVPGLGVIPTGVVWGIQVTAVVLGHVVGAWAGHAAARKEEHLPRGAHIRSQVPLAVLMIFLTSATLWSLGQNLVFASPPASAAVLGGPPVAGEPAGVGFAATDGESTAAGAPALSTSARVGGHGT